MSAKTNSHLRVRMLCEGAMMVALAQVLSYIKLMELPNGGSLTPAMFPILLFAVRWGLTPGLMAGFTFGLLQLIFDGAYAWGWQSMLLDYLVAFTPLGLAGLFKGKKWGIFVGTVVGCLGRFIVHYISGVTIYKILAPTEFMKWTFTSPSAYSIVYNGSYMLPNTIIALVIAAVLYKPLKKYILGQDLLKWACPEAFFPRSRGSQMRTAAAFFRHFLPLFTKSHPNENGFLLKMIENPENSCEICNCFFSNDLL